MVVGNVDGKSGEIRADGRIEGLSESFVEGSEEGTIPGTDDEDGKSVP